jgi:hypothetical protein
MMKTTLPLMVVVLIPCGCSTLPSPGVSLCDARFAEEPYIVKRGPRYYLHYRMALDDKMNLRRVLIAKKNGNRGMYYLTGFISHPEWGGVVERPVAYDGFAEFAKKGAIFWLDPDGTETKLQTREMAGP